MSKHVKIKYKSLHDVVIDVSSDGTYKIVIKYFYQTMFGKKVLRSSELVSYTESEIYVSRNYSLNYMFDSYEKAVKFVTGWLAHHFDELFEINTNVNLNKLRFTHESIVQILKQILTL